MMLRSTASRLVKYKAVSLEQLETATGSIVSNGVAAASTAVEQKAKLSCIPVKSELTRIITSC